VLDLKALHSFYDIDGDGNISYNEFISALRSNMSKRACNIVNKAWAAITNGDEATG